MLQFIEQQLLQWPEANERYAALGATERRKFRLGDFEGAVQFNPARIRSTGAKTDAVSIGKRPCFLCAANRPAEQVALPIAERFELLLNPFPIFPVHFTIAAKEHVPQERLPLEMATLAEELPEMAIFFNGARAGASAPDHEHMQAVLQSELPIIALTERMHRAGSSPLEKSSQWSLDLPFDWWSAIVTPDAAGMLTLDALTRLEGRDADSGKSDFRLLNAIMWIGGDGLLRAIVIPRQRHRPLCYPERMVSPGTIDMAGVVIVPRREDFEALTNDDLKRIYIETGMHL